MAKAARYAALVSLSAAAAALAAGGWAIGHWADDGLATVLAVSVGCSVFGILSAWFAEAVSSERRTLRLGLAGLILNLLIGAAWLWLFIGVRDTA